MLLKVSSVMALIMVSQAALAGSANGVVNCKSASGRTTLKASFPVDEDTANIVLTVDGKTTTALNQRAVEDLELNGKSPSDVFVNPKVMEVSADRDNTSIGMTALELTNQKFDLIHVNFRSEGKILRTRLPYGGEKLQFKAILNGLDPRTDEATELPKITLSCTYVYQI
jgi:hypothetical protein